MNSEEDEEEEERDGSSGGGGELGGALSFTNIADLFLESLDGGTGSKSEVMFRKLGRKPVSIEGGLE